MNNYVKSLPVLPHCWTSVVPRQEKLVLSLNENTQKATIPEIQATHLNGN